jgi:hypothetical protein
MVLTLEKLKKDRKLIIKRISEDAVELAKIELPEQFEKAGCLHKGMYALGGELKEWLRKELNAA